MAFFSNSEIPFEWFIEHVSRRPVLLAVCFVPIPLIGLAAEIYSDEAFARSGSLLVCAAIFSVYLNHFLSVEAENVQNALRSILKIGSTEEEILKRMNPEIMGEARRKAAANLFASIEHAKEELPGLRDSRRNLVNVEFLAGVIGILIWGFGDLVPF